MATGRRVRAHGGEGTPRLPLYLSRLLQSFWVSLSLEDCCPSGRDGANRDSDNHLSHWARKTVLCENGIGGRNMRQGKDDVWHRHYLFVRQTRATVSILTTEFWEGD